MKLHFHGASYDYSPRSFVDTDESEMIGKFRGNTYKIRRSIAFDLTLYEILSIASLSIVA